MKLNETQVKLLAETFFTLDHIPGWRTIAELLLTNGSCTIAGEVNPWFGGVGNYVKKSPALGSVGCSLLTFDVDTFLQAVWVRSILAQKKGEIEEVIREFEDKLGSIGNLLR